MSNLTKDNKCLEHHFENIGVDYFGYRLVICRRCGIQKRFLD